MDRKNPLREKFIRYRRLISNELTNANDCFGIYKIITDPGSKYNRIIKEYNCFFAWIANILSYCLLMSLSKLLIVNKQSITICSYLNFIASNPVLFGSRIESSKWRTGILKHRATLVKHGKFIQGLKDERNSYMAHLDKKKLKIYKFPGKEIGEIINELKEMINFYSGYFDDSENFFDSLNSSGIKCDIEYILKTLWSMGQGKLNKGKS